MQGRLFEQAAGGPKRLWYCGGDRGRRVPSIPAVPLAVRADRGSRHSMRFPRHFSTVDSGMVERQETQIVQSWLTLDDILP